jgi:signal transduction histidine kinase
MRIKTLAALGIAFLVGTAVASAATKDDAVAMVKKAVATIKADGPEKAYAEISAPGSKFVNGEVYAYVAGLDGITLAHPTNPKLIGKNMQEVQDVDGKYFAKDMNELAKKQASFWYEYKFANPVTKKIQVKDNYCEAVGQTRVCAGLYQQ